MLSSIWIYLNSKIKSILILFFDEPILTIYFVGLFFVILSGLIIIVLDQSPNLSIYYMLFPLKIDKINPCNYHNTCT